MPEAISFKLCGHGWCVQAGVILLLGFGWRYVAYGLQKTAVVEPIDPLECGELHSLLSELEDRRRRNEKAEEERTLLMRELAHRIKNGFALVQAIARQTFSRSDPDRYNSFSQRLGALAATYDLILAEKATSSSIVEVIETALRAHVEPNEERLDLNGPAVLLPPDAALPLSLVIHELATNATKYGSLGSEHDKVEIKWRRDGSDIVLTWSESGGPPVSEPTRKGFGSVLIERAFPSAARARTSTDFRTEGLIFRIAFLPEPDAPSGVISPPVG